METSNIRYRSSATLTNSMLNTTDDADLIITKNGKEYRILALYEDISLRLEVISEIMDEIIESYPEQRSKYNIEKRIEQKMMLRRLSGD